MDNRRESGYVQHHRGMNRHISAILARQDGILTRSQLALCGVSEGRIRAQLKAERWSLVSPTVVATFTGELTESQRAWAAVLHAGGGAMLGSLTAARRAGLVGWERAEITVLVPYRDDVPRPMQGVHFVRTRRNIAALRAPGSGVPCCHIEAAVLMFASSAKSKRTAEGVVAAAVQQRLTTTERLAGWLEWLKPLRRAPLLRTALEDIAGGAQSVAEIDVRRLCKQHRLTLPARQIKRRDAEGRVRSTDCEWDLDNGRKLVLEVDGPFHMEVHHWEADIARQRALTDLDRITIRCTAREVRDETDRIASDLRRLGVPAAA